MRKNKIRGKKNTVPFVRQRLYISQKELADYLGVSRALLNMEERMERTLPRSSSELLTELQIKLSEPYRKEENKLPRIISAPQVSKPLISFKSEMKAIVDGARFKIPKLKEKLKETEKANNEILETISLINDLILPDPKDAMQIKKNNGLKDFINKLEEKLNKTNEIAQGYLKIKIAKLEAEAAVAAELID